MLVKLSLITTLAYCEMSLDLCRSLAKENDALLGGTSPQVQIQGGLYIHELLSWTKLLRCSFVNSFGGIQ